MFEPITYEMSRNIGKIYVDTITIFKKGEVISHLEDGKVLYSYIREIRDGSKTTLTGGDFPLLILECEHPFVPIPQSEERDRVKWKRCVFCARDFDVDDDILEEWHKVITNEDVEEYLEKVWKFKK